MKIIFLGAPGAGKGTQAEIVAQRLGIPTVSTGNIIRAALKNGTQMGLEAKKFIEKGALVPDDIVIGIIRERLVEEDCAKGFILDGFPRTVPQAEALDKMGVPLDAVISIEVADEEIERRMSGRRVCPVCGATYHMEHQPSADGVHCDKCASELVIRKDDAPEIVRSRLAIYHETAEPLKAFYASKGSLKLVEGVGTVEEISARTFEALGVNL